MTLASYACYVWLVLWVVALSPEMTSPTLTLGDSHILKLRLTLSVNIIRYSPYIMRGLGFKETTRSIRGVLYMGCCRTATVGKIDKGENRGKPKIIVFNHCSYVLGQKTHAQLGTPLEGY